MGNQSGITTRTFNTVISRTHLDHPTTTYAVTFAQADDLIGVRHEYEQRSAGGGLLICGPVGEKHAGSGYVCVTLIVQSVYGFIEAQTGLHIRQI